jgi:hypothetical protein
MSREMLDEGAADLVRAHAITAPRFMIAARRMGIPPGRLADVGYSLFLGSVEDDTRADPEGLA